MSNRGSSFAAALKQWWREQRESDGFATALLRLITISFEFLRDSLPGRRRQRYGDVDYDWEQRVNTTSATVSWRARLIGLLNSPYQPVEPALFREVMDSLAIDFLFTFIDIGSGKGRALLLAAEFPFRRIIGIELLPELHAIAQENIRRFSRGPDRYSNVETVCGDAAEFAFPAEPTVLFLNNPLPASALRALMRKFEHSLEQHRRSAFVVYANPIFEEVVLQHGIFIKSAGTHQYSVFRSAF